MFIKLRLAFYCRECLLQERVSDTLVFTNLPLFTENECLQEDNEGTRLPGLRYTSSVFAGRWGHNKVFSLGGGVTIKHFCWEVGS